MNTFARPQGPALEAMREAFAEIEQSKILLRPHQAGGGRVSASRLYAAAAQGADDAQVQATTGESRAARGLYRRTVAASALYSLPEARAASSGAALARHGEGCRIRTERSRAEPNQYFVVVEISQTAQSQPTSLVVCDNEDRVRRFPLPTVRNGVAQMIAEADSDLMRLIGDPTTKVYLR
jgi:hypothetical protein